ncbi:MAG: preQ(1) synthase [Planctomycetota bacterium]|jgi:7-cyano-7-deazaguanine reductase
MSDRIEIELFDNPRPKRDYCITIRYPEFTSVCPRTGQPDFGEIVIEYCPDKSCIILDDLTGACKPCWMKVTSRFKPRGGMTTEVVAEYKAEKL